jgi:hypothetical protein
VHILTPCPSGLAFPHPISFEGIVGFFDDVEVCSTRATTIVATVLAMKPNSVTA